MAIAVRPVEVRPLEERDLPAGERIFREAFGTAHGVADPSRYWPDRNYVRSRWTADPGGAVMAGIEGASAGIVMAVRWGSVGVLGPLAVDPLFWRSGVAGRLLESILENPRLRDARLPALSTAAGSVSNVRLYQRFGFWPGFLIPVLAKPVDETVDAKATAATPYAGLREEQKDEALKECAALTGAVYEGLDVSHEIRSVDRQALGDTLLLWSGVRLDGFAVCHCGAGTEAGEGACYVKFGAARTPEAFESLLGAVEELARARGLGRIVAGVNSGRRAAYRHLLARGFRALSHSVAMQRRDAASYDGPDALVIDDWR
ncbi:MAG: GNAT family N-acetyltransferase [Bryobacterales bacterium]|nr:GNAT family N-acetyltransferase [Bryobacterales bacterium]